MFLDPRQGSLLTINFESDKFSKKKFRFRLSFHGLRWSIRSRASGVSLFPLFIWQLIHQLVRQHISFKILEVFIKIRLCISMPKKSPLKFYLTQTPKCGSSVLSIELLIFVPKLEFPFLLRLIVRAL